MKKTTLIFAIITLLFACNRIKEKAKDGINASGELVGKAAAEFTEGVTEGIERTLDCSINVSTDLNQKGISTGKFQISNDSLGGYNNMLSVYLIFDKNFNNDITVKITDKKGVEIGRTQRNITAKKGEAKYYDFRFDKRSQIEVKSDIVLE